MRSVRPVRPVRAFLAATVLGVMTLTAACGQSSGSATPEASPATKADVTYPVTVDAGNGKITLSARPKRIVSLSPTMTEMMFAIGAGPQVVAVDDYSTYPANAPKTALSAFKPNAEAVIGYKPDLVVLSHDMDGIVKALGKVQIPVLLEPAATTLDDTYDQLTDLGTATGNSARAKQTAATMRQQIDAAVKAARPEGAPAKELTYYHELTNDLSTATSKTFIGQIYGLFGLKNVADEADKQGSGYPKLSQEYLLKADPDLIFIADTKCCGQSAATVAKRPGWADLTAVKGQRITELDDDVASRWGPRLVDLVKLVGAAVQKAQ